ncbi:MAG: hypothetical protein GX870_03020, partial [Candidatus Marinimicrobia bacterium]|nr:hypothetical protein [Candidatus Neomarinimicrobiota bacterium]
MKKLYPSRATTILRKIVGLLVLAALVSCAATKQTSKSAEKPAESSQNTQYNSQALTHFMNGENYALQGDYAMAVLE